MPVVPSFSGYSPTPNMAEAYSAGARTRLQKEQIAQQAAEASQRIALGYAQVAAETQRSQMELAAKQQLAQQELLRHQQETEMTRAYREASLGIERSNLERMQNQMAIQQAEEARKVQGMKGLTGDKLIEAQLGFNPMSGTQRGAVLNPPVISESGGERWAQTREGEELHRIPSASEGVDRDLTTDVRTHFERVGILTKKIEDLEKMIPADESALVGMKPGEDLDLASAEVRTRKAELKRLLADREKLLSNPPRAGQSGRLSAPTLVPGGGVTNAPASTNALRIISVKKK